MSDLEARALARIADTTDIAALRTTLRNARGKSEAVERAALRRLAEVSPNHTPGTVAHACWSMVYAVEELRRLKGQGGIRMNRMRKKIAEAGEHAALESCVTRRTTGFDEVLAYDMPELLAETIVLRHGEEFSDAVKASARLRLAEAGIQVDARDRILPD